MTAFAATTIASRKRNQNQCFVVSSIVQFVLDYHYLEDCVHDSSIVGPIHMIKTARNHHLVD